MTAPAPPTPPAPTPPTPPTPAPPAQDPPKHEVDWKAEARKHEQRAKDNAQKAKDYDALVESQKTEAQRLQDRADQAERDLAASRVEALRLRVAAEKGLTPKQAARLQGTTEDELNADADDLLAEFGASTKRVGQIDQGVRKTSPAPNQDEREVARNLFGGST